jgi:fido (protein-threonine AMPylation protein)
MMVDQFGNVFESRLLKGKYKDRPNNPKKSDGSMHQYCPPEQADSEMERLLSLHTKHEKKGVSVEVAAAWLHHRFTQIHPYQDGNGRVARALASLLFIKAGWFPVVVTRDDRARYIDALEVADEGDLQSLISFFNRSQKQALFEAMQDVTETIGVHSVDEAIAAARKALITVGTQTDPAVWQKAKNIAKLLMKIVESRFTEVLATLNKEIANAGGGFGFNASRHDYHSTRFYSPREQFGSSEYEDGCTLEISRNVPSTWVEIETQAYAIGSKFRGLIGFRVAFQGSGKDPEVVSGEPFQVNYAESYESAERRFRPWLEESLVNALTLWRKSL